MTDEACINHLAYYCNGGTPLPKSFPKKKLEDEDFLLKAIKAKPYMAAHLAKFVPEKVRNNDDFVRKAAAISGLALSIASDSLLSDEVFVLNAVRNNPIALQYAPARFRDDKALVLELLGKEGRALEFVSDRLKNDRQVVLKAIEQFGCSFQFASESLLKDPELMEAAADSMVSAQYFTHLHDTPLLKRKDFVSLLLSKKPSLFLCMDKSMRDDRDIVLMAMQDSPSNYRYISEELKADPEIAAYASFGSSSIKLSIPKSTLYSAEFREQVAAIRKKKSGIKKQEKAQQKQEGQVALPKFLINKDKANPSMYSVSVKWEGKKEILSPQIQIKSRYILSIDDYLQPKKDVALFRYLIPSYAKEIKEIYDSLSSEIKQLVSYDTFSKDMKKRLMGKETDAYREIRFAFRRFDGCTKIFTFYNPYERTSVMTFMGFRLARPRAWYSKDLAEDMKEIKGFEGKDLSSLQGIESRATDGAVYHELEEMNYTVLIEEVDQQAAKKDSVSYINSLVNKALEDAKEEEKDPPEAFDLKSYESVVQFDERLNLPKEFEKVFVQALDDARP
ncbi:MAG: DUF4116 domain-containing protein [Bacilli bacterium]|nr:DUF4116 domain-containing protein [Bacilli bacterium]